MTDQPMRTLTEAAFAADELRLFLDTHPCDGQALALYRKAAGDVNEAKGALPFALNALDAGKQGEWDWVQTPWPWETED